MRHNSNFEGNYSRHDKREHNAPPARATGYAQSVQGFGAEQSSGKVYGYRTQSYVALGDPLPTMNSRPDWLDDSDTSGPVPFEGEQGSSPVNTPADGAATESQTSLPGSNGTGPREDAAHPSVRQNGAKPSLPTVETGPSAPNRDSATRSKSSPAAPSTPRINPLEVEWFVREDGDDPWGQAEEGDNTDDRVADQNFVDQGGVTPSAGHDTPLQGGNERPRKQGQPMADAARAPAPAHLPKPATQTPPHALDTDGATAGETPGGPTAIEPGLYADRRYRAALERMQFAQWEETLVLLKAVARDYPNNPTIAALINEAELKASVVDEWVGKVKGRRLTVGQEMILRRAVPILLLLLLFAGAAGFYRVFVQPSRQAVAITQTTLRMVEEARQMAFAGRFAEALTLYNLVLERDPGNPLARQGLREAQGLYSLTTEYDIAMSVARAGNLPRAAAMLEGLLAKSPGFRDAESQLDRLTTELEARRLFEIAEADFRLERWQAALQGYEAVAALNSEVEAEAVRVRLQELYWLAGQALVNRWPENDSDLTTAQDYFRRAAAGRRNDAALQTELNRLDRFFRGQQALERSDLREAVNIWRSLYDEENLYLGGYLGDRLYRAYLSLANRAVQQNDTIYAMDLYQLALELNVRDKSDAQRALDQLRAQSVAPTATPLAAAPTATPVQALAYQPSVAVPPPQPTPTPDPTPTPEPDLTGWIAFRTNRNDTNRNESLLNGNPSDGTSIYVMRPDGSEQQPAPESIRSRFGELAEAERRSPDGQKVLQVVVLEGRENPSIFVTDLGLPEGTQREFQLTNYNRDEYDPVWSPKGDRIAFVSNHPGNDEIFTMDANGGDHRRLTWNEWEWDKHPTFSPDGSQLAFFTNRSGPRQIFVMDVDGGNQRNISRNAYDDWDPIWIK